MFSTCPSSSLVEANFSTGIKVFLLYSRMMGNPNPIPDKLYLAQVRTLARAHYEFPM